jgi:hypothetical protein
LKVRVVLVAVAALALAIALIPLPQTVAPDWTITTLDASRKPLTGITVREVWQQYSLEHSSHEEDLLTNIKGEVHFPRRTYWTTIGGRLFGCAREISGFGVHASCGSHSYLVAFGKGVDTLDWTNPDQEYANTMPWQHSTLVLNH